MKAPWSRLAILLQAFPEPDGQQQPAPLEARLALSGGGGSSSGSSNAKTTPPSSTNTTAGLPPTTKIGSLTFAPCGASLGLKSIDVLQCANLSVPVSYKDPAGEQATVTLVRLPASKQNQRIGTLWFNPGGPGVPATRVVDLIVQKRQNFSDVVRDRFDIIGMDPRGVGLSTPKVMCDTDISNEMLPRLDPNNQTTLDIFTASTRRLAESCRKRTGRLFDNVDTMSVAKDMEAARLAMGGEQITFFGQSYGTQLGAQYAALFPGSVRALLLDGVLQHSNSDVANQLISQSTSQATLLQFFKTCTADPTCPLAGKDVAAVWASLVSRAKAGKLQATQCDNTRATGCLRDIHPEDLVSAARNNLFFSRFAPSIFGGMLASAANSGDGTPFATSLRTGAPQDNEGFAFQAVTCQDGTFAPAPSLADLQSRAAVSAIVATVPGFEDMWLIDTLCTGWTPTNTNPLKTLGVRNLKNPTMIVSSVFDPATSLVWARGMVDEIQGSQLFIRNGTGHTSYFVGNESKKAMDDYLVNLKLPPPGTMFQS
ncbi:hypothetical protein MAPG_11484 [Magnaporthiopsis poae ATCC 64411]|uniref:Uncharacterized protein n=1 Tax=Magnaporthiopsis poae (strain ATCC 64411 / 73-15) TaxID=644358 RepID=A0A0C4EFE1_MAGP6|nr:hypothetical protein MAPG_11484 [Magnaporthiopsis poae ATCC 64411]